MGNADFRALLKKFKFSDCEVNYFTQSVHEKPALGLIFRRLLNSGKKSMILDVGCGIGLLEENLVKNGFSTQLGWI